MLGLGSIGRVGRSNQDPFIHPTQLGSALAAWHTAQDAATIILNGSTVSQWNDKSGNGINVSQSVASQQPAYNASDALLGGQPSLTFDGVNDYLFSTTGLSGISNVTIIGVIRVISGGATEDEMIAIGQTGLTGQMRAVFRAGNNTNLGFSGWARDVSSTLSLDIGGAYHVFGIQNTGLTGPNNASCFRDGVFQTLTPSNGATLSATAAGLSFGSLQGSLVANYYANVSIAESIIANVALDQRSIIGLTRYLAQQWRLSI